MLSFRSFYAVIKKIFGGVIKKIFDAVIKKIFDAVIKIFDAVIKKIFYAVIKKFFMLSLRRLYFTFNFIALAMETVLFHFLQWFNLFTFVHFLMRKIAMNS